MIQVNSFVSLEVYVEGCPGDDFKCDDSSCVPAIYKCDGEKDCFGGEDELNCGMLSIFPFFSYHFSSCLGFSYFLIINTFFLSLIFISIISLFNLYFPFDIFIFSNVFFTFSFCILSIIFYTFICFSYTSYLLISRNNYLFIVNSFKLFFPVFLGLYFSIMSLIPPSFALDFLSLNIFLLLQ